MSWPAGAECVNCGGITSWYARHAPERIRCKCGFNDAERLTESVEADLRFTMELQKDKAA